MTGEGTRRTSDIEEDCLALTLEEDVEPELALRLGHRDERGPPSGRANGAQHRVRGVGGGLVREIHAGDHAVEQAARRAALFGLASRARFVIGDLTRTGLPAAAADAATSIDAFHFAADPAAAAAEARRILRPGRRLVLTNWQPKVPGDSRLPARARIDWPPLLRGNLASRLGSS